MRMMPVWKNKITRNLLRWQYSNLLMLKNGYIYYVTESHWDKEKKRTVDNRVGIGTIDPDHAGMLFPGKAFA